MRRKDIIDYRDNFNPVYDISILKKKYLTQDDVLGVGAGGVMAGDVKCIVCKRVRVSGITVCINCIEYVCDEHLYRHPNCDLGK